MGWKWSSAFATPFADSFTLWLLARGVKQEVCISSFHFLQGEKVENYCLNEWPYDVIEIWNVHRKEKENKAGGNSYQALCTLMMPISLKDDWFVRTQCRSQYQIRIIRGEIRQQARTAQPKEIITFLALETGDIWVMTCPHIIFGALVVVATSFDGEKWPNLW